MSYERFSTPPPSSSTAPRRPPLRQGASYAPSFAPVRSFSLPTTPTTPRRPIVRIDSDTQATTFTEKEVYMGALISPVQMNEKRSIDVPCIILTEPDQYAHPHPRIPSPPPKQILLLPSTSLALPLHSNSTTDGSRKGWLKLARSVLVFTAIGLGVWHVWSVLGQFDERQQLHSLHA